MRGVRHLSLAVVAAMALSASAAQGQGPTRPDETAPRADVAAPIGRTAGYNAERNAYFGDLHVHTRYSFDAYIFNVRATPDDAYNYAKGATVRHASGYDVRLTDTPLDFLAVTDHAEYLGVMPAMNTAGTELSRVPYAPDMFSRDPAKITNAFSRVATSLGEGRELVELRSPETNKAAWGEMVAAAQRHNEPGRLTTFVGYEFTSAPGGMNLHRNVIFAGARAPERPFTAFDAAQNPEALWRWMDGFRAQARQDVIAIPHNMNGSDGRMFERTAWDGRPLDRAYADLRMRNEPLAEMSQIKGTSETHPALSPNDEQANFEIMESYIGSPTKITKFAGGYVRDALKTGISYADTSGFNPFKFGFIGASDTHNAASGVEEGRYNGKVGFSDGTAAQRYSVPPNNARTWDGVEPNPTTARFQQWGAAGLAGVWAEENTRQAIFAALRRKETFATSGPRIRVRYFVGHDYPADLARRPDLIRIAYARGVPMGGDLLQRAGKAPQHLVWAVRDPHSGWLQRVQIVKGWVENGETKERVFDVACSDGIQPDPRTYRCADNGATVNLSTCAVSENKGAVELRTLWTDPTFDASQRAFYYVRALENPSCRWSTWDAIRAGVQPSPAMPKTIQERAWSSPVWYAPRR